MSQDNLTRLKCKKCDTINYYTTKNPKSVERKLELKKFCKQCKKHQAHKETKKKG